MTGRDQEKYRITGDYHTHTIYSRIGPYLHGKGRIIDNAAAAHKGLKRGRDNRPRSDRFLWTVDLKRIPQMRKDIEEAVKRSRELKVYLGVEADIVDTPNGLDVSSRRISPCSISSMRDITMCRTAT